MTAMKPQLTVSLVQADLHWHDSVANRARFDRLLSPLAGHTDLIVLPEMFSTGFTMEPEKVAEPVDGPTTQWLRERAKALNAVITGSIVTSDAGRYWNRLIWMRPDGSFDYYDKRHLFRMAGEHQHYADGKRRAIVELGGWKICPLVCYDLRFPAWSRNRIGTEGAYDALIYVANWPERRRYAWQTLLRARAIENLSFCVGVNRVGKDGKDIEYSGDSTALDFMGRELIPDMKGESVSTVTLDKDALMNYRERFPAYLDADDFDLKA
jgi:predicted amidohydrolase